VVILKINIEFGADLYALRRVRKMQSFEDIGEEIQGFIKKGK
jgi:hypothetical protein